VPLAHPLTQAFEFPVSPLVAAFVAAALVLVVALACPDGPRRERDGPEPEVASWAGSLSPAQWVARVVAVAVLLLAVAAGRLGADDELENLAPALIVGAAWPLLVLASVLVGPVWRWIDPWDTVARPLSSDGGQTPGHVWTGAVLALPWVWYLSAYSDPLGPRSVGAMLALYSLATLAGCLAVGRTRWLSTSEPLGIVFSWLALVPRRHLADWEPPRGAEALLAVLAGGVLFGAARRSELWGSLNTVREATLVATLGLLGSCAAAYGALLWMATRSGWRGFRPAAARAVVPAVAGIVVAVALDRNRLFTSVQLLPGLLGDPFGEGWNLLGRAGAGLDPAPLGTTGLLWAQLAVLVAGHFVGAAVMARRTPRRAREPTAVGLAALAAASVIAVASH
jgi:predicted membrane protein